MAKQVVPDEEQERVFRVLLADPGNSRCAECQSPGPRWASANLGVFLCIQCSGLHRKLGVHVSQVRSVNLDRWTAEQLDVMRQIGNEHAAAVWEAQLPPDFRRPMPGDTNRLQQFIWNKYVERRYYRERTQDSKALANTSTPAGTKPVGDGLPASTAPPVSIQSSFTGDAPSWTLLEQGSSTDAFIQPGKEPSSTHEDVQSTVQAPERDAHSQRKRHILAMYANSTSAHALREVSDMPPETS
jgi:stromal membrane-associated protein